MGRKRDAPKAQRFVRSTCTFVAQGGPRAGVLHTPTGCTRAALKGHLFVSSRQRPGSRPPKPAAPSKGATRGRFHEGRAHLHQFPLFRGGMNLVRPLPDALPRADESSPRWGILVSCHALWCRAPSPGWVPLHPGGTNTQGTEDAKPPKPLSGLVGMKLHDLAWRIVVSSVGAGRASGAADPWSGAFWVLSLPESSTKSRASSAMGKPRQHGIRFGSPIRGSKTDMRPVGERTSHGAGNVRPRELNGRPEWDATEEAAPSLQRVRTPDRRTPGHGPLRACWN